MRRWLILAVVASFGVFLEGAAPAQSSTVADTLRGVRFGNHVTYERAVLDLGTRDTPAESVPYYRWSRIDGNTVVRVRLPSVDHTLTAGGKGLGVGISRYYVVRTRHGHNLFVDFILTKSAGPVNVFYLDHPARIVVDVPASGGDNSYPGATFGKGMVLMQPRAGHEVGPETFMITGYGRPFEAQGLWRIKSPDGKLVDKGSFRTSDWSEAWGRISLTVDYPDSLSGKKGILEVGERSPGNGSFDGVSVPLSFR